MLNLIDLLFTLYALGMGLPELNPFMQNVSVMVIYKTFIVGMLCVWLSKRKERLAKYGLTVITICYGLIDLWHIIGLLSVCVLNMI